MHSIIKPLEPANDNALDFDANTSLAEFYDIIDAARREGIEAMDHDPDFLRELEDWSTRDDNLSPDRPIK